MFALWFMKLFNYFVGIFCMPVFFFFAPPSHPFCSILLWLRSFHSQLFNKKQRCLKCHFKEYFVLYCAMCTAHIRIRDAVSNDLAHHNHYPSSLFFSLSSSIYGRLSLSFFLPVFMFVYFVEISSKNLLGSAIWRECNLIIISKIA